MKIMKKTCQRTEEDRRNRGGYHNSRGHNPGGPQCNNNTVEQHRNDS